MLSTIVTHAIALFVGVAGGAYLHYKYGAKLAALESKVKGVV